MKTIGSLQTNTIFYYIIIFLLILYVFFIFLFRNKLLEFIIIRFFQLNF